MKNSPINIFPYYIVGLAAMAGAAWLTSLVLIRIAGLHTLHWLIRLIPALLIMLLALGAHLLPQKQSWAYIASYLLNSLASGWAIGVLLNDKSIFPATELLLALLPAAILGLALVFFMNISTEKFRIIPLVVFSLLALTLIGVGIYVWCAIHPLTGCTFVFSGLFFLPLPHGYNSALTDPRQMYRYLSFSGFGAFILIFFVVAFVLSDGEILDGLDFDLGGSGKKKGTK